MRAVEKGNLELLFTRGAANRRPEAQSKVKDCSVFTTWLGAVCKCGSEINPGSA
jgi:hypothetical protein